MPRIEREEEITWTDLPRCFAGVKLLAPRGVAPNIELAGRLQGEIRKEELTGAERANQGQPPRKEMCSGSQSRQREQMITMAIRDESHDALGRCHVSMGRAAVSHKSRRRSRGGSSSRYGA